MAYLRVKNWERYQHYHKREAPWIKLYASLLDDYDFGALPHGSKADLVLIWLLAQRTGNRIQDDPRWVQSRIGSAKPPDLQLLINKGFLLPDGMLASDASTVLAQGEERREEERRGEIQCNPPSVPPPPNPDDLGRLWNATRGEMRRVTVPLNEERKRSARARLAEVPDLERWKAAIVKASKTRFCRGLAAPRVEGEKPWIGNFDWLVRPQTLHKIEEGTYDSQPQATGSRPATAAPVLTPEQAAFIEQTGDDYDRQRFGISTPTKAKSTSVS